MAMPPWRVANPEKLHFTLGGLYAYDNTIFDDAVFPDGIDRDTLIFVILDMAGNNVCRYSSPAKLKNAITVFFKKNEYKFRGLIETTTFDYDPLVNYDLTITEKRTAAGNEKTESSARDHGTGESRVSGYDSSSYAPDSQNTTTASGNSSGNRDYNDLVDVVRTESGDNSARSTQYMIREQREIVNFNVYEVIASDFEDDITIPVYGRTASNIFGGGF